MRVGKYLILLIIVLFSKSLHSQSLQTSNLPIIIIETNGQDIQNEPKISAHMGIIFNASGTNAITDPFNNYDGKINIELRGSSSQGFEKKSYGFELKDEDGSDRSEELIGLPEEEDWVLNGPYSDKSLIRNQLTFHLWEATGRYGSRTRLCEVIINDDYKGVYVLLEKIKRNEKRLDISKLTPDENSGDDLTGGYIIKIDKSDGSNSGNGFASTYEPENREYDQQIYFQYDYPKNDEITSSQANYIRGVIRDFESDLASEDFKNPLTGYRPHIDVGSFIDFALINELSRNVDGYRLSTFLFKDKDSKGGRINLGPPWDFNLGFGNANYCEGSNVEGWAWDFNQVCAYDYWLIPFWWRRLLEDPFFKSALRLRWESLRATSWSNSNILAFIDARATELSTAQGRNRQRWPEVNDYIWPNSNWNTSYTADINYLKSWTTDRLKWLDSSIGTFEIITALDPADLELLTLYPNPVKDRIAIRSGQLIDFIEIIDLNGRIVRHQAVNAVSGWVDLSGLPSGSYILQSYIQSTPVPRMIMKE